MPFPKIFLPTITSVGLIAGSIITISNFSSSSKSYFQNTQLKKNDNSINNLFEVTEDGEVKIKNDKFRNSLKEITNKFNSLSDKFKEVQSKGLMDSITLKEYLDTSDRIDELKTIQNQNKLETIDKKIKKIEKDMKNLSNLLEQKLPTI